MIGAGPGANDGAWNDSAHEKQLTGIPGISLAQRFR